MPEQDKELLLTKKEVDDLWDKYETEHPAQGISFNDVIMRATIVKARPMIEKQERERIIELFQLAKDILQARKDKKCH